MIQVTLAALKEIKRLQTTCEQVDFYCRLGVQAGGCSGSYYTLELTQETQTDDLEYQFAGISFRLSPAHLIHLENLKLDYVEDLMGGTFRFDNPSATMTCRCGVSFA
jgi:iron-sulfur cluster assembly protein